MARTKAGRDISGMRDSVDHGGEMRMHFSRSKGAGTVTCRMFHPDGFVMSRAHGHGYDKTGDALGDALMLLFPKEIAAMPVGNGVVQGSFSGNKSLDGATGVENMLRIITALGFDYVRMYETGKGNQMLLALNTKKAME